MMLNDYIPTFKKNLDIFVGSVDYFSRIYENEVKMLEYLISV